MEAQTSLLLFLTMVLVCSGESRKEGMPNSGVHEASPQKKESHSPEPKAARCSYTFTVPQPQMTGALCVTARGTGANATNRSEVAALRRELGHQQQQLEELQALVEREGGLTGDIRALRRESSGLSIQVTQLYSQMVQQVLHSKEQALVQSQLENLLLNTTSQLQQVMASHGELEKKYKMLSTMVNSQTELMGQMMKQCQQICVTPPRQVSSVASHTETQKAQTESPDLENGSDVQKDQSVSKDNPASMLGLPTELPLVSFTVTKNPGPWRDCQHVLDSGRDNSGIYLLQPHNSNNLLQAWCEHGGWTVFQRRQDGSVNFFRNWEQYKQGFGNLDGEYWLGLEYLYWLSAQADYRLRVVLEDWQGRQVFAEYDSFRLEPESDSYRLRLGEYHGNAGDSLSWHNNKAFTTLDRDRDAYAGNCAHYQKGGWWYHMCAHSNLNGVWYRGGHYRSRYQDGVYWAEFHGGSYSLKKVTMMIKPM